MPHELIMELRDKMFISSIIFYMKKNAAMLMEKHARLHLTDRTNH